MEDSMKALLPSCISISGSAVLYQMELSQIQIAVRKNETKTIRLKEGKILRYAKAFLINT